MAKEGEVETKGGPRNKLLVYGSVALGVFLLLWLYWHRNPEHSVYDTPRMEESEVADAGLNGDDPRNDPPAPREMTAILGGLKVGSFVASSWKVAALSVSSKPEVKGALTVFLKNGKKALAVWVAPKGAIKAPPPHETDAHAIYVGLAFETDFVEQMMPVDEIIQRVRFSEQQGVPAASAAPAPSP